jgi:hypothetical protein
MTQVHMDVRLASVTLDGVTQPLLISFDVGAFIGAGCNALGPRFVCPVSSCSVQRLSSERVSRFDRIAEGVSASLRG